MTSKEFVQDFKREIAQHPKLRARHPFVKAVKEGSATMDQIRAWACQDYKFRNITPQISMMRYLACSDPAFRPALYEVVEEETEGLSSGSAGHIDLFIDFTRALDLTREQLEAAPMAPATAAHLYFVELMIHKYPWFVVMAAQIAAEGTFPGATKLLGEGLLQNYGFAPESVRFFTVHTEEDAEHGSLAEKIAEAYLHSPSLQDQAREVGLRRMELLYDIWSIDGFAD